MISKKRIAPILFLLFILTFSLFPTSHVKAGWLTGEWDQRVSISIDSDDVDTALSNLPILVYISDSSGINNENITFVFDEVGANSLKIAITTNDGVTECYVEVEKWDLGNEKAWLWVKVPSIASESNTTLYLYYDNDHADNVAYVGATNSVVAERVWDDNFVFVAHMRDDPDNASIRDSTQYDNDGAKLAANEPIETVNGQIDSAQYFDGNDDYISVTHSDVLNITSSLTVTVWYKVESLTAQGIVAHGWDGARGWWLYTPGNRLEPRFQGVGGAVQITMTGANLLLNEWYYSAIMYDPLFTGNATLYVNSVLRGTEACKGVMVESADDLFIGTHSVSYYRFKGFIDEVRVSNIIRSTDWIKVNYESERDDLLDWGIEDIIDRSRNVPQVNIIEFNTTIAGNVCGVSGDFSDVEGLSGYIFWNNATNQPTGVNSSFIVLAGVSDSTLENVTLPTAGDRFGVKYFVNDTDNNWSIDTRVIFPSSTSDVESDFLWIAIAIALSIIVLLLSWLKYGTQ